MIRNRDVDVQTLRNRLYKSDSSFRRFWGIDENKYREILECCKLIKKNLGFGEAETGNEVYFRIISFIVSPQCIRYYKKFDEKVAFLIMAVDPELELYKSYLGMDSSVWEEVGMSDRNEHIKGLMVEVRDKIGFYDSMLLRYEIAFFERFIKHKELFKGVKQNYADEFFRHVLDIDSLGSFSSLDLGSVNEAAMRWISMMDGKGTFRDAFFHLWKQARLLGVKTKEEKALFLVLALDSDLELLRIFEEEFKWENVEKRSLERFGFFDRRLIYLEKAVSERVVLRNNGGILELKKKTFD